MVKQLLLVVVAAASWAGGYRATADTPEDVVRAFLTAVGKSDLRAAAKLVEGSTQSPRLEEFEKGMMRDGLQFEPSNFKTTETGDAAVVTLDLVVRSGARTMPPEGRQTVNLRRTDGTWRIVPLEKLPMGQAAGSSLSAFAAMLANPDLVFEQAKRSAKAAACLSHLKQVSTAVLMLMGDSGDKLLLSSAKLKTKLAPYVKNADLFVCPESGKAYSFNDNLIGRKGSSFKNPAQVVMLYEGSKGVLDFRHDGRACVAFMDGHCKLYNKEQAKSLMWK
jgi:prepilin-type processing-associated H-X9-DG protein